MKHWNDIVSRTHIAAVRSVIRGHRPQLLVQLVCKMNTNTGEMISLNRRLVVTLYQYITPVRKKYTTSNIRGKSFLLLQNYYMHDQAHGIT